MSDNDTAKAFTCLTEKSSEFQLATAFQQVVGNGYPDLRESSLMSPFNFIKMPSSLDSDANAGF